MNGSTGRRAGLAMVLGAGMVLAGASGASGQELALPRIPDARPAVEGPAVERPAVEALRVEAPEATARPGTTGRWLMVGGGALLAAALGDYLMNDASFGLSDRSALAYGAGLTLFGVGAWQAATAEPVAPPALAADPPVAPGPR